MHAARSIFGSPRSLEALIEATIRAADPSSTSTARYRDDFTAWCRDIAGKDPEAYQTEIGCSVVENRTTMVPSCNGAGKSYIAALIIIWWVTTREDPYVVWTAPRWAQVKKTIGRYLQAILTDLTARGVKHGLRVTLSQELYQGLVAVGHGVSPADGDEQGISGVHAENVLVVVDEADRVAPAIWAALDSFMTTDASRMLGIGNPHTASSTFAAKQKPDMLDTRVIHLDGLRLPTMSRSAVEAFPELAAIFERDGIPYATEADAERARTKNIATPRKYAEWLREWSEDHPYWHTKVRGKYPPASEYQMFTQQMLDQAYARSITPPPRAVRCYGFDIAEQGGDETVGYLYESGRARRVYAARGGATPLAAATEAINNTVHTFERVAIDANGVGWGVYEQLKLAGYDVVAHKGGHKARRPDVYANRKAELFYGLQKALLDGELDLDPEDDALAVQLLSIRWVPADKRTVETRAHRNRRGDESPDRADALSMAVGYAVSGSSRPTAVSAEATTDHGEWNDAVMTREF